MLVVEGDVLGQEEKGRVKVLRQLGLEREGSPMRGRAPRQP